MAESICLAAYIYCDHDHDLLAHTHHCGTISVFVLQNFEDFIP